MSPDFLPYGRQNIGEEEIEAVVKVLHGDFITQGPEIEAFETRLCEETGAAHAVVVSSGTAALHLAMLAFGVGRNQHVITTPLTFAATSNAVLYAGGSPLFADIDPRSWCLSPESVSEMLDTHARRREIVGIVPVHFAGSPAHAREIRDLARSKDLFVIDDACHAIGASWQDEKAAWRRIGDGSLADATILSFHPVKHITSGEGGAVLTSDAEIARRIRALRHHGIVRDEAHLLNPNPAAWYHEMQELGYNYRITDIHCAIGRVQLEKLAGFVEARREIAACYMDALADESRIRCQWIPDDVRSSWHLFAVEVPERDRIFGALRAAGIGAQVHYPLVYQHPYYRQLGFEAGLCPRAEQHAAATLSLPMYPGLKAGDIERVIHALTTALDRTGTRKER